MTKYLCMFFVVVFAVICLVGNNSNLVSALSKKDVNFDLIENGDDYQLVTVGDYNCVISALNLEIVSKRNIAGRTIIEGYSNLIDNNININGRKVNVQISISDDGILMGSPLIYNSF